MKRRRRSGMSTFTIGMIAIVVTMIAVYLGFTKTIPFVSHYEVKVAFKSANNLRKAAPVRIAGVEVGKVTKIERARKGRGAKGFNASIKYWKPAYRDSAIVSEAMLGEKEHDLSGYIDRGGVVAGALDRNPDRLKALITNFRRTAGAFARENTNLEAA